MAASESKTSTADKEATLAARSLNGDCAALEELVRNLQPYIYKLSQRFLFNPEEAEDATQEILMKIITRLSSYKGKSRFTTWAYTIAANYLRDVKRRSNVQTMTFEQFSEDLAAGLAIDAYDEPDRPVLEAEVLIGCTTAMLQCLDDDARLAYTLGEVMELDHNEAAMIVGCTPATYRKRLSRARNRVVQFMIENCGIVDNKNNCKCNKRIDRALDLGRVSREQTVFLNQEKEFGGVEDILLEIKSLERKQRAVALYKIKYPEALTEDFTSWFSEVLEITDFDIRNLD